jgi:hypothetical protein
MLMFLNGSRLCGAARKTLHRVRDTGFFVMAGLVPAIHV